MLHEITLSVNGEPYTLGVKSHHTLLHVLREKLGLTGTKVGCENGECGRLIDEGIVEIGGKFPVNTSGGLMSKGEPVGASAIGQMVHLVQQLRGKAGPVQVEGARSGLSHVIGAGGNCAVTLLKV